MHTLVFASQKGGSGKTTLSGHLAVEAQYAGVRPVALIDTDPQGTASLLAHKGDAAPSVVVLITASPRAALVPHDDRPAPPELPPFVFPNPRQPDNADKLRRIVVFIRQEELERLGIVAVKKGISRHDIVRGALDDYFRKLSAEFSKPCACMEGGSPAAPLAT